MQGRRVFLSARTERNQRCAKGTPSMNTSPQAGVHRRRPPGPPIYGSGSLWLGSSFRRAKSRFVSVLLPGHRDLVVAKSAIFRTPKCGHPSCRFLAPPLPTKPASLGFGGGPNRAALTHAAWCLPTCWVRRVSFQRPQQLPSCHSYARVGGVLSTQNAANFSLGRPLWAGARRMQGLVFGAAGRKCLFSRRASHRKTGSGVSRL